MYTAHTLLDYFRSVNTLWETDGGRRGDSRWELEPAAVDPPLRVLVIKMHQQFESPAAVVATVRRRWQPTFDAMATPFSAVCGDYATLEDDVLSPSYSLHEIRH